MENGQPAREEGKQEAVGTKGRKHFKNEDAPHLGGLQTGDMGTAD